MQVAIAKQEVRIEALEKMFHANMLSQAAERKEILETVRAIQNCLMTRSCTK